MENKTSKYSTIEVYVTTSKHLIWDSGVQVWGMAIVVDHLCWYLELSPLACHGSPANACFSCERFTAVLSTDGMQMLVWDGSPLIDGGTPWFPLFPINLSIAGISRERQLWGRLALFCGRKERDRNATWLTLRFSVKAGRSVCLLNKCCLDLKIVKTLNKTCY